MNEKKETKQLYDEVLFCKDIESHLQNNEPSYQRITLCKWLNGMLEHKHLTKAEVIAKSQLNPIYGYHIFSGHRKPSRDKLLQIAFGFELDVPETQSALKIAEQPVLYARNKRDSVLLFSLEKRLSLYELEELMLRLDLPPLIHEKESNGR